MNHARNLGAPHHDGGTSVNTIDAPSLTVKRALDVDSHEMVPGELRDEIVGPTALAAASKT